MTQLIDGRESALKLKELIGKEIRDLEQKHHITPGLAVICVGDDPASQIYVKAKSDQANKIGIRSIVAHLPGNITKQALKNKIIDLNKDPSIHGILVQLPLPPHIDPSEITNTIDPDKDVDGLHNHNIGCLSRGTASLIPCTPLGIALLLRKNLKNLQGQHAVIIGRSNLVGKPLAQVLLHENCTVTIAHSRSKNLADICKQADIIIAAVGQPNLVKQEWVKPGATVIDVGMNRLADKKLTGDVDFESVSSVAGAITPVPGGVGPMTVACLLLNTVIAAGNQANIKLTYIPSFPLETNWCPL